MSNLGCNRVFLFGTVGADPELRATANSSVLNLRLATNEQEKRNGQWEDHTEWHTVVVWGRRAEALAKLLEKGSRVLVEGRIRTDSWEKDGSRVYRTKIRADQIYLAGDRRNRAQRDDVDEYPEEGGYEKSPQTGSGRRGGLFP